MLQVCKLVIAINNLIELKYFFWKIWEALANIKKNKRKWPVSTTNYCLYYDLKNKPAYITKKLILLTVIISNFNFFVFLSTQQYVNNIVNFFYFIVNSLESEILSKIANKNRRLDWA